MFDYMNSIHNIYMNNYIDTYGKIDSFYFGQVSEGIPHGQGILNLTTGASYEGEFKHGLIHGSGEMIMEEGDISLKTIGQFKSDKWNGQGIAIFNNGSFFMGEGKEDKPWDAILLDKNYNILERWKNGKKEVSLDNLY